jgi:hypothetical protein
VTSASPTAPDGLAHLARRDVFLRPLRACPGLAVLSENKMSSLDRVVPQATQLPVLNRLVQMIVLGETELTWLQRKIGFKSLRNVYYYIEAARWARLLDEETVQPTRLGRFYVDSRFDPRLLIEGVRGRALFDEVMRMTRGEVPTVDVVSRILRRWSFRYSKGTLARRAHDFCRLIGSILEQVANPSEERLVVHTAWIEPPGLLALDGAAVLWPVQQLILLPGFRRPGTPRGNQPAPRSFVEEET